MVEQYEREGIEERHQTWGERDRPKERDKVRVSLMNTQQRSQGNEDDHRALASSGTDSLSQCEPMRKRTQQWVRQVSGGAGHSHIRFHAFKSAHRQPSLEPSRRMCRRFDERHWDLKVLRFGDDHDLGMVAEAVLYTQTIEAHGEGIAALE